MLWERLATSKSLNLIFVRGTGLGPFDKCLNEFCFNLRYVSFGATGKAMLVKKNTAEALLLSVVHQVLGMIITMSLLEW